MDTLRTLYAAQDNLDADFTTGEKVVAGQSQFDKKLSVIAKDSAGNKVILPSNAVQGISSSDPAVATVATVGEDAYVIGNKAGTDDLCGCSDKRRRDYNLTQTVTVKADAITVDKLEAGETTADYVAGKFAYDYFTENGDTLMVTNQYGIEYENADIAKYDAVLGFHYTVSVVSGTGSVEMNAQRGAITKINGDVNES